MPDKNQDISCQQIDQCIVLLKDILGTDLFGTYLYGSSVIGGLQRFSDIDLFVVANRPTTYPEKSQLIEQLLRISGIYSVSKDLWPIELTIVIKSQVNPWHYPPIFDFQYGDWLRKEFESGNVEPWATKVMPDLAIAITQLLLANRILFGPEPRSLLDPVPYDDFIMASTREIDSLMTDINWDTRNVLLTYARIWSTVETDSIRSKPSAAAWCIEKLPNHFRPVMQRALLICEGKEQEYWGDLATFIKPCADFMVDQTKKQISLLEPPDYKNRAIKLAK